jgi:hypothetical protein
MVSIAVIGAGGKMGGRITDHLLRTQHDCRYVDTGAKGIAFLAERDITPIPAAEALQGAQVVILAVPDEVLGKVAESLMPHAAPGTMLMTLDGAAPYLGDLPKRDDLTYFVAHPCHTPMFNDETDPKARRDFAGGIHAKQHIVCVLIQGPEEHYAIGELVARDMFGPVMRSHRISLEQMVTLEPVLSETVVGTCLAIMKEALDEAVARGVPAEAARDFLLGHLHAMTAVTFNEIQGSFSVACNLAIDQARPVLFQPGWKSVFETASIRKSVHDITRGTAAVTQSDAA